MAYDVRDVVPVSFFYHFGPALVVAVESAHYGILNSRFSIDFKPK